jgi:hypothetical protein
MTNVRCFRCSTTNFIADEACRVCGAELRLVSYSEAQGTAGRRNPAVETIASIPPFEGIGDVLGPTLNLFVTNIWLITKIVFVVVAPFEIFKALSISHVNDDWQLAAGLFFLDLLCGVLIVPALIYALTKLLETGKAPSLSESYGWGVSKLGKLIVCAAITWLLEVLGFMLFVIPGILIALSLALVYPVAVLEKRSVSETLRRSRELTRGHRGKIFLAAIVMFLTVALISIPVELVLPENGPVWQFNVLNGIITNILKQAATVFVLVLYLSILRTLGRGRSVIK